MTTAPSDAQHGVLTGVVLPYLSPPHLDRAMPTALLAVSLLVLSGC